MMIIYSYTFYRAHRAPYIQKLKINTHTHKQFRGRVGVGAKKSEFWAGVPEKK